MDKDRIMIIARLPKIVRQHLAAMAQVQYQSENSIVIQAIEEKWQKYCREVDSRMPQEEQ
jgi:protein-S-isoprenylcysteine O-methyltransferase Ste14